MGVLIFAKEDGLNPKKAASTNGGEYHSPCPGCGGKDRFIIWEKLDRYFCRQCRKSGDAIQYGRDFRDLSYQDACKKSGVAPRRRASSMIKGSNPSRDIFQFDPRFSKMPPMQWSEQAASFILHSQEQLRKNHFALDLLFKRGFSYQTMERFHLGWNPTSLWLKRSGWGIGTDEENLWIPSGVVIPSYTLSTQEPIKLKIRRSEWWKGDQLPKYVEVSGSMQSLTWVKNPENKPIVVLESELDAFLLHQYAGDLCCPIALGGASKKPDLESHGLLSRAPLIIFSLDVDLAGAKAFPWWKKVYPQMKLGLPPIGKSPGDAHLAGIDLRKWISITLA